MGPSSRPSTRSSTLATSTGRRKLVTEDHRVRVQADLYSHSFTRKFFLHIEFLYQVLNLVFSWFALGNFYIAFVSCLELYYGCPKADEFCISLHIGRTHLFVERHLGRIQVHQYPASIRLHRLVAIMFLTVLGEPACWVS